MCRNRLLASNFAGKFESINSESSPQSGDSHRYRFFITCNANRMVELKGRLVLDYQSPSGRFKFFWCLAVPEITIAAAWTLSRLSSSTCAANRSAVRCDETVGAITTPSFCPSALVLCRAMMIIDGRWWDESRRIAVKHSKLMSA